MRPDLSDMIAGLQRLLTVEVMPRLDADPYVQEQIGAASLVLEFVKGAWSRAHLAVAAEDEDLHATVRHIGSVLAGSPDAAMAAMGAEFVAATSAPGTPSVSTHALDAVLAHDRVLADLLARCVRALDAQGQHPTAAMLEARAVLDGYLIRHARRRAEWVEPLGITW